jgi:hypothetical protein
LGRGGGGGGCEESSKNKKNLHDGKVEIVIYQNKISCILMTDDHNCQDN